MADLGATSIGRVGNDILSVEKAYILVHSEYSAAFKELSKTNISGLTKEEQKRYTDQKGKYADLFDQAARSVAEYANAFNNNDNKNEEKSNTDILKTATDEADFIPIKVQYNPSTLHFTSRGGKSFDRYSGIGGMGSGTFQVMDVPYEVVLNMDLIFDETVNSNAFATYDASNIGSISGMAQAVKTGILGSLNANSTLAENTGKRYSVQNISELFVAAIANAYTRMVCVVWNKTIFWGELCGVNVEYTMFNRDGDPIRSKVHLEIRQDERFDTASTPTNWEKTYKKLFTSGNELAQKQVYSTTSVTESVANNTGSGGVAQQAKSIASNFFNLS